MSKYRQDVVIRAAQIENGQPTGTGYTLGTIEGGTAWLNENFRRVDTRKHLQTMNLIMLDHPKGKPFGITQEGEIVSWQESHRPGFYGWRIFKEGAYL